MSPEPVLSISYFSDVLCVRAPAWIRQVPAYGIGGIAAFWLIERVARF